MLCINNQKPSTLDLRALEDVDFLLPCLSNTSIEIVEEQLRGGRDDDTLSVLVGETDSLVVDEAEKFNLGPGIMIPLRLGDRDMFLALADPGS